METTLAILMVLGIFVVIPAVIAFAVVGALVLGERRVPKAKRTVKGLGKAQVQPA